VFTTWAPVLSLSFKRTLSCNEFDAKVLPSIRNNRAAKALPGHEDHGEIGTVSLIFKKIQIFSTPAPG
jgi:hypothetical protein